MITTNLVVFLRHKKTLSTGLITGLITGLKTTFKNFSSGTYQIRCRCLNGALISAWSNTISITVQGDR
jgi:hypothetical protein